MELIVKLLRGCTTTARAVNAFLDNPRKYAADDSLYMKEVHFVVALGAKENPTMGEMAESLNVTPGAVTQLVSRLEKKGYVLRAKDPIDKRQTTLSLTEKGQVLCKDHIAFDQQEHLSISELLGEFSDGDLEKFIRYERLMWELFTKRI